MKTLVVFYSRTGNCRTVAGVLAAAMSADIEEIISAKDYSGPIGWMAAGKDSTFKTQAPIGPTDKNHAEYDLVIVGTPIWAFTAAAPVISWMAQHGKGLKSIAFFCTMGGSGDSGAYKLMQEFSRPPLATMSILDKQIKAGQLAAPIQEFVRKLSAAEASGS